MRAVIGIGLALAVLGSAAPALAQQEGEGNSSESLDREARALFEAGSTAFDDARYEDALGYFRRAYELSGRPALLYNVGVTADRLRRDSEALFAFERFLEEVPEHPKRREVEVRIAAIHRAQEQAAAEESEQQEREQEPSRPEPPASTDPAPSTAPPPASGPPTGASAAGGSVDTGEDGGVGAGALVGPIGLGVAGLAGVAVAIGGIAGAGGCVDRNAAGECIEEDATRWSAVGLWGGLGLAAVVGAVVWLVVATSGDDGPGEDLAIDTRGLSWRF